MGVVIECRRTGALVGVVSEYNYVADTYYNVCSVIQFSDCLTISDPSHAMRCVVPITQHINVAKEHRGLLIDMAIVFFLFSNKRRNVSTTHTHDPYAVLRGQTHYTHYAYINAFVQSRFITNFQCSVAEVKRHKEDTHTQKHVYVQFYVIDRSCEIPRAQICENR